MSARRALALAALIAAAAAARPRAAAAQFFPPQPARYLLTTVVSDARAVWVNPAALAKGLEASVGVDLTAERAPDTFRLAQYGATLASRNLGFGWSHDRLRGGGGGDAFALGAGLGEPRLSAGFVRRWFSGGVRAGAWDLAARLAATPALELSLVWRDIGLHFLGDSAVRSTLVPAGALALLGGRVVAAGEWQVEADGWKTQQVRLGATATAGPLRLLVRADLSSRLERRAIALAAQWGGPRARAAAFVALPRGGDATTFGATAMAVSTPPPRRR